MLSLPPLLKNYSSWRENTRKTFWLVPEGESNSELLLWPEHRYRALACSHVSFMSNEHKDMTSNDNKNMP